MSQPGRQYALYLHHSVRGKDGPGSEAAVYVATPGHYQEELGLDLPAGSYQADWVDPAAGQSLRSERFTHTGGQRILATPAYTVDLALRIKGNP
jgi:hypothetical protein